MSAHVEKHDDILIWAAAFAMDIARRAGPGVAARSFRRTVASPSGFLVGYGGTGVALAVGPLGWSRQWTGRGSG
jgi:hypothetical protein